MLKPSSVVSSFIADGKDLIVEFVGGKCFRYAGAAGEAPFLDSAESKGAYLNAKIKPNYTATQF